MQNPKAPGRESTQQPGEVCDAQGGAWSLGMIQGSTQMPHGCHLRCLHHRQAEGAGASWQWEDTAWDPTGPASHQQPRAPGQSWPQPPRARATQQGPRPPPGWPITCLIKWHVIADEGLPGRPVQPSAATKDPTSPNEEPRSCRAATKTGSSK